MSETTSRVLQLLGLLQSRRVWTGEELAERLAVTTRSVRRDVERLRDLGYPVHASKGHGGGYQLGAGAALPPLLLDPDEAVAVAVCLRLAAGGSVAGVGESALRALSKLDQVMPARLRSQVAAVHDATVTLPSNYSDSPVEPEVLMTLARACRDREHITAGYVDRAGSVTERRLEPYQLVTTGRRWYLLAYDRDRQDWRSLRLDRMADVRALGSTFTPRQAPDAAAYVRHSISASPYRYVARVRYQASEHVVAQHFSPTSVTIEADSRRVHRDCRSRRSRAHGVLSRAAGVRIRGAGAARSGSGGGLARRAAGPGGGLGRDPEAVGEEQERCGEIVVGGVATDLVPVHLLADGAHAREQGREIAVMLVYRRQLLGHHLRRRQHRHRDREHLDHLGAADRRRVDRHAVETVQHVHHDLSCAGFEQPVLRRAVDPEAGLLERLGRSVGVILGDHEVDVVHWFRAAVHPDGVAACQGELGPLRLEGRRGALEGVAQLIVSGRDIGNGHRG